MENAVAQEQTEMSMEERIKIVTARAKEIAARLADIEIMLNSVKSVYSEKDQLVLELKELIGVGGEITHEDAIFTIVDNFAERNTVFRPAGVKRFDLGVDSVLARTEKMMKDAAKKEKKPKA